MTNTGIIPCFNKVELNLAEFLTQDIIPFDITIIFITVNQAIDNSKTIKNSTNS